MPQRVTAACQKPTAPTSTTPTTGQTQAGATSATQPPLRHHTDGIDRAHPRQRVLDASAHQAVTELTHEPGKISGDRFREAIEKGIADKDNQAAGREHREFNRFAHQHPEKMSDEAKDVMGIYSKYAKAARDNKKTGLNPEELSKMFTEMRGVKDSSAQKAVAGLDKVEGKVSGDQFRNALLDGVSDHDNHAASSESEVFKDWHEKNAARLSPEAEKMYSTYQGYATKAQEAGKTGISGIEYKKFVADIKAIRDVSAQDALAVLAKKEGPISGGDLRDAISSGVRDPDNAAAGREFGVVESFLKENKTRLTPEATEVSAIYERYAREARAKGHTGLETTQFGKMVEELGKVQTFGDTSAAAALSDLSRKPGLISANELTSAIRRGASDLDGHAISSELTDFKTWASINSDRLSATAKDLVGIYEKYANVAKGRGDTVLSQTDFNQMILEMKRHGQQQIRPILSTI